MIFLFLLKSVVICQTWVASLQEENYPNAREFIPERWLSTDGVSKSNPYFEVPFGVGKRMCPGKRIAEYQLLVLTAKVLKIFSSFDYVNYFMIDYFILIILVAD